MLHLAYGLKVVWRKAAENVFKLLFHSMIPMIIWH